MAEARAGVSRELDPDHRGIDDDPHRAPRALRLVARSFGAAICDELLDAVPRSREVCGDLLAQFGKRHPGRMRASLAIVDFRHHRSPYSDSNNRHWSAGRLIDTSPRAWPGRSCPISLWAPHDLPRMHAKPQVTLLGRLLGKRALTSLHACEVKTKSYIDRFLR